MQQQTDLLNDVKSHFDHWRTTRTKRGKIPDYLWDKVKSLIGKYALSTITEALSLNTTQMREHLDLDSDVAFVEVSTNTTNTQPIQSFQAIALNHDNKTCSIELHKSSGETLKIYDYPVESLSQIISQFMG